MKRRLILPVTLLLAVVIAAPVVSQSDEFSVGISMTALDESDYQESFDSVQLGFNVGYRFLNVFLADWSAISLPPGVVAAITGYEYTDDEGNKYYVEGYSRPAFANFFDIGLGVNLGPFVVNAQAGLNLLYLYKQDELDGYDGSAGANLRAGVGLRFDWWSVLVNGTVVFADLQEAGKTLAALASEEEFLRTQAINKLQKGLLLGLGVNLYL